MNQSCLLRLENVTYESETGESLRDVSFTLKKGEKLVIFGPERSGLESVCPIIAGLVKDYIGHVYYKEKSIKTFDYIEMHNYRKEIGYLQRDYGLINNMNVFENISLPLEYHSELTGDEIEKKVNGYIREMNLDNCRDLRPVNLTRSEKLKTAYLRSIVFNPDLILVEHSLASQCMLNIQTFLKNMINNSLTESKSVIFITYNPMQFFGFTDRYVMLYNGRVVFDGTKEDYFSGKNPYIYQYIESSLSGPMEIM